MRFRLANSVGANQGGQQLANGIGSLFQGFAMAPMIQAQAAEEAAAAEGKRRLMEAQEAAQRSSIAVNDSTIGKNLAEAAVKNNELATLNARPDMLKLMAASRAGVSVPEFGAALSETTNGAPMVGPSYLSAPIEGVGPSGRTANLQEVIASLYAPAMATPADKMNFEQLAKARGEYQDQGALDQALAAANGGDYMRSSAISAVRGKKEFTPFAAVGNTGTALNQITGAQPVTNPAMYTLFGDGERAGIRQKDAQAGASKASAASSWASARKTNQDREMGEKGVLQQTDQGLALVNPRNGTARLVTGPDGTPLTKPGGMNLTEGERKAATLLTRLRGSQEQMLTVLGADPGAAKPGTTAEFVRWVSGDTPANLLTPEARQRVEAAQLDMLDAALTLGTGAAYTREQLEGYRRSYFPQIGDKPKQVEDKQVRLANVIRAAEIAAGRAEPLTPRAGGASGSWGDKPPPPAALPPRNAKGWALQEDAKGNRAYVSPDGRQFEEVR